ncbi:hypothetical protein [Flavobacterium sp. AJR]|uniref:hypothetical protein n=1 Tax=Flavobacterium sp. AJR TaxID=1979369 RepID=UPI000A3D68AD|nr:hypothetical protein [Flavobacterium sp. AJR]OUL60225.1 hypothetical protein B8T70_21500 [Flavobacterium sp. AJR]
MKNRLLPLLFVLGCYSAYSQVGIGTLTPSTSSQLEVFASDRGILIPRVTLTSSTDITTIKDGNKESLLVFNTATVSDIKPGYYYWYEGKWNRITISSEATGGSGGVVGGNGVPGNRGEAGYPGADVSIYTDQVSGIVYVQNIDGTWSTLNGKNGLDGKNGIAGGIGLPGEAGLDGTIQMYIDQSTGIIYIRDPKNKDNWIPLSVKNGIDGVNGKPGTDGVSIPSGSTIVIDNTTGTIYVLTPGADPTDPASWTSINGKNGLDGKNGLSGGNGVPGAEGTAGIDGTIQMYIDQSTGIVYVRDPKDTTKWIPLTGERGIDGIKGIDGEPGKAGTITTLDAIVKDSSGNIYAYVGSDGTIAGRDAEWAAKSPNWVKINGLNGEAGIPGTDGEPGTPGSITTLDAIVKTPSGDIYAYVGADKTVTGRDKEWVDKSPNWVKINGLNGEAGIPGTDGEPGTPGSITTLDAIVKTPSGDIYAYVGADKTVAGRDKEWVDKSQNWVKINGLNGEEGIPGIDGEPGTPGLITTLDAIVKTPSGDIYAYVGTDKTVAGRDKEWSEKSSNWVKINGLNGKEGIAGATGEPGKAGSITTLDAIVKSPNGDIYAYVGTSQTVAERDAEWAEKSPNWIKINGLNGKEGIAGATGEPGKAGSITTLDAIVKSPNGDIYAYIGTSQTVAERDAEWAAKSPNWAKINGLNGESGIPGADGEPGTPGSITTLDAIVKSPNGDIYAYVGTDKTVAGRDKEWVDKSPNWVRISGKDGVDGAPGLAGGPGAPGDTGVIIPEGTTTWINTTDGVIYVKDAVGEWIAVSGKVAPNNILGIQVISDDYVVTVDDYTVIAENLTKDITITLPDPALSKGRILVINQFDMVKADDTPIVVNFNHEIRYSSKARYTYMAGSLFGGATAGSMKVTLQSNGVNWYVITYTM